MLNYIEEIRKNELMNKMDEGSITSSELLELKDLTNKGISHLEFKSLKAA